MEARALTNRSGDNPLVMELEPMSEPTPNQIKPIVKAKKN
jgi:hypothetical protein